MIFSSKFLSNHYVSWWSYYLSYGFLVLSHGFPMVIPLNPIKPPFSHGFPMVFPGFSHGFRDFSPGFPLVLASETLSAEARWCGGCGGRRHWALGEYDAWRPWPVGHHQWWLLLMFTMGNIWQIYGKYMENIWLYGIMMIEGSLEVKLPTIWTDEKQSREEAERRERLEEAILW